MVLHEFDLRCPKSDHLSQNFAILELPYVGAGGEAKSTGSLLEFSKRGATLSNLNI